MRFMSRWYENQLPGAVVLLAPGKNNIISGVSDTTTPGVFKCVEDNEIVLQK